MRQLSRTATGARGVGLLESLIAIVVLCVGVLGMARFQVGLLRQTSDAQNRVVAAGIAETLLAYVRVDAANAACYTVPAIGTCASPVAAALAATWAAEAAARGFDGATATLSAPARLTARLAWSSHAFHDIRSLEATTDVRP